jgi:hypothetical protein
VAAVVPAVVAVAVADQAAAMAVVAVATAANSPQSKPHEPSINPATSRSAGFFDHWHSGTGVGNGCFA